MTPMKVETTWAGGLASEALSPGQNHVVRMDTVAEQGGADSGLSPKKLLLSAVCGCTLMDVVEILQKMRVSFTRLTVSAEADQTQTIPKMFTEIRLTYHIDVAGDQLDKVEKAVELSQTKYCGVSIMLKAHCPILTKVELMNF